MYSLAILAEPYGTFCDMSLENLAVYALFLCYHDAYSLVFRSILYVIRGVSDLLSVSKPLAIMDGFFGTFYQISVSNPLATMCYIRGILMLYPLANR
jgi:hypothetical protein